MAGHSKWANIKHRKAHADKKRGKLWSKCAAYIITAARLGGGDPKANTRLFDAIADARAANMPADTIERAIKRGTGELEGADPEELVYEGFAPGGVAVLVEALTDNRKRTAPDIKHIFDKQGGNMGATGSAMRSFERKGVIVLDAEKCPPEDELLELVAEHGAEDLQTGEGMFTVLTPVTMLEPVKKALAARKIGWVSAQWEYLPLARIETDVETARAVQKLVAQLEEYLDVQNVYTNLEVPEALAAEMDA
jgi:YebC/PmpR family DNA-binding regulatory protein